MRRNISSPALPRRGSNLSTTAESKKIERQRRPDSVKSVKPVSTALSTSSRQKDQFLVDDDAPNGATRRLIGNEGDRPSVAFLETPAAVVEEGNRDEKAAIIDGLYKERRKESRLDELSFDNAAFLERIASHRRALHRSEEEFLQFSSDADGGGSSYVSPGGRRRASGTSPLRSRAPLTFSPAQRGAQAKPPLSTLRSSPSIAKRSPIRSDGMSTQGPSTAETMLSKDERGGKASSTAIKENLNIHPGNPHQSVNHQDAAARLTSYQNSLSGSDSETAALRSLESGLKKKSSSLGNKTSTDADDRLLAAQERLRRAQAKQNEVLEHMAKKEKRRELKRLGSSYAPSNVSASDSDGSVAPSLFSVSSRRTTVKSSSSFGMSGSGTNRNTHGKKQVQSVLKRTNTHSGLSTQREEQPVEVSTTSKAGGRPRSSPTESTISRASTIYNLARKESILLNPHGDSTAVSQNDLQKLQDPSLGRKKRYFDRGNLGFLYGPQSSESAGTTVAQGGSSASARQNVEQRMSEYIASSKDENPNLQHPQALGVPDSLEMRGSSGLQVEHIDPALAISSVKAPRLLGDVSQFLVTPSLPIAEEEAYYLTPVLKEPVGKAPSHVVERLAKEKADREQEAEAFKQKTLEKRATMAAKDTQLKSPPKWLDLDNVRFSQDFTFQSPSNLREASPSVGVGNTTPSQDVRGSKPVGPAGKLSDSPVFSGSPSENLKWTMAFMLEVTSHDTHQGDLSRVGTNSRTVKPSKLMDHLHYVEAAPSFSSERAPMKNDEDTSVKDFSFSDLRGNGTAEPLHRRLMDTPLTPRHS